jgi:glyoxylase-like metal-dependent hydrolase (beta-lactamase superfamily II)
MTGFPNVAIVVGTRSTLVVDTGMGPKNGATVARVVAKFAPNNSRLFLTTTHYHTEHVTGEPGLPAGTVPIRNAVQQQELEKDGHVLTDLFRGSRRRTRSCLGGRLALANRCRPGPTLISGDVVQNKTVPNIIGEDGTPTEWLATLDKVAMLNVVHVYAQ